jgi:hypothetical protein
MAVKIYNVGVSNIRVREQGVFTAPELVTDAGLYIESAGGYYAGANIIVGSKEYAIIVAPKELGETTAKWKNDDTSSAGSYSTYDGKANMTAIEAAGIGNHPAAEYCANLNINGFNDWHLPAPDELEVCYRYLKPHNATNSLSITNLHNQVNGFNPNSNPIGTGYTTTTPTVTSSSIFRDGEIQAFRDWSYWTSMESAYNQTYYISFYRGGLLVNPKTNVYQVRAVRWLEV